MNVEYITIVGVSVNIIITVFGVIKIYIDIANKVHLHEYRINRAESNIKKLSGNHNDVVRKLVTRSG